MPLRSHASRLSKLSTSDCVRSRVRPSPRSSNHNVSSATPSGSPSKVKVCTIRSGRTSWKQPRNAYSTPSRTETNLQLPPVRASQYSIRVSMAFGPTHRANSAGSVWARNSWSGVAAKSRVMRMTGSLGSASMVVSVVLVMVAPILVVGVVHPRQDGVEAAVPLLSPAPVTLDPVVQHVEDLRLQVHWPRLRPVRPAHQPGVLEHPQVLVDGLQRHLVRLSQLAYRRVTVGKPGHNVAARRIGKGGEDPGQCVRRHRLLVSTLWFKVSVYCNQCVVNRTVETAGEQAMTLACQPWSNPCFCTSVADGHRDLHAPADAGDGVPGTRSTGRPGRRLGRPCEAALRSPRSGAIQEPAPTSSSPSISGRRARARSRTNHGK